MRSQPSRLLGMVIWRDSLRVILRVGGILPIIVIIIIIIIIYIYIYIVIIIVLIVIIK